MAAAAAPVSLPKIDIDPPDEPVMLEEGTALGMGDGFGPTWETLPPPSVRPNPPEARW